MRPSTVLVVDDEAGIRAALRAYLEDANLNVIEADSAKVAHANVVSASPDIVVLDYRLPDGTALEVLPKMHAADPDLPVIVLTAHGSIDLAVKALQEGAAHFLTKPVELPTLLVIVQRLLEQRRSRRRQMAERSEADRGGDNPFLGSSKAIGHLEEQARRYLPTNSPILIVGETGVGKGVLAKWIHENGPRADEPFVHINCAGLTTAFLDAELFGHAKGAFTGATSAKPGLLEVANHGTVFLDEVGDVALEIQPKLLKVLEDKTFRRMGEVRDRTVDVRLVAATNRRLEQAVGDGDFRDDLYFRLSALPLRIPALRERRGDINQILDILLERLVLECGRPTVRLSEEARADLIAYDWPGNIREVRNVLERGILLCDGDSIAPADLQFCDVGLQTSGAIDTDLSLDEVVLRHIEAVLAEEDGHVGQAANRLGVPRSTLYKRLKKLGIVSES